MDKSSKENMTHDIENRLDDFFDENESADPVQAEPASLQTLKSMVLSIDWEITEECLTDLIDETEKLLPQYVGDRLSHALLRMLKAVGRYIRKRQAQSHPDAIKRVLSVFSSLEQLTGNAEMDEDSRKSIVAKEIAAFKKLKEQVESQQGVVPKGQPSEGADGHEYVECQQFEQAMSAVEQRLNSQVEDLKSQLATLQEELGHMRKA